MTSPEHFDNITRRARRTLYVVTTFYVGIGFFVAAPAALSGDRLSAFLGFLIISGALGAAVVISAVLRLGARMMAVGQCLEDIRERLEKIKELHESVRTTGPPESSTRIMDFSAVGRGDPSRLAAARLDRDMFPRLSAMMEEEPPAEIAEPECAPASDALETGRSPDRIRSIEPQEDIGASDVATRNLLREWKLGLRTGDLAACRSVFSALVDTADTETVMSMGVQLEELGDRTEASLRAAFSRHLTERDYAAMLEVGEQIASLLPDRPVAREFERVKPHLLRRLEEQNDSAMTPTLRVVQ